MIKILKKIASLFFLLIAPEKASVRKIAHMKPCEMVKALPAAPVIAKLIGGPQNLSALFAYQDQRVKEMVWEIKYRKNSALAEKVGVLLYEKILVCAEKSGVDFQSMVLAPIPASEQRRRERGFNQCEIICEAIVENSRENFCYEPNLLVKIKNTPHQADLNRTERIKNVVGSFAILHPEKVRSKIIFIVDDVITTGHTVSEAGAMLLAAGAKSVYGFAIAH